MTGLNLKYPVDDNSMIAVSVESVIVEVVGD